MCAAVDYETSLLSYQQLQPKSKVNLFLFHIVYTRALVINMFGTACDGQVQNISYNIQFTCVKVTLQATFCQYNLSIYKVMQLQCLYHIRISSCVCATCNNCYLKYCY